MAGIQNSLTLTDRMSPVLHSVLKAMDSTMKAMEHLDKMTKNSASGPVFRQMEKDIKAAERAMSQLDAEASHTDQTMSKLSKTARNVASALASAPSRIAAKGAGMKENAWNNLQRDRMAGNTRGMIVDRLQMAGGSLLDNGYVRSIGGIMNGFAAAGRGIMTFGQTANSIINGIADRGQMAMTELNSVISLLERGVRAVSGLMGFSDQVVSDLAKVNLFNYDPNSSPAEAYGMVYQAAQNSRGSLSDTNQLVNRIMMSGVYGEDEKSFGSATRMAETLNKALTISGGTAQENSRALLQLSQALSSGRLQGDELRSIREQAPYLARMLAEGLGNVSEEFAGTTIGDLKTLGAEGKLTSDVIIRAFESMEEQIDKTFEDKAPVTWGQGIESIKNTVQVLMAYLSEMENGPLQGISQLVWTIADYLQSDNGITLIAGIMTALGALGSVLSYVVNLALQGITWIMSHSSVLIAILLVIGAVALATGIQMMISFLSATWPLLLAVAIIAILIQWIMSLGVSVNEIVGFIAGIVMSVVAFIWNLILGVIELVIAILKYLINPFVNFANFLANVFTNPISSIIYLFQGMADTVLSILESIASALDFVFGSNMAATVAGWRTGLKALADEMVAEYAPNENYQTIMDGIDFSVADWGLERWGYGEAFDSGYEWGSDLVDSIGDMSLNMQDFMSGNQDLYDAMAKNSTENGIEINGGNLDSVGKIKGDVDISEEDIKLLRDMAARDYLLNLQQITPVAHISFGDVRETADVNKIMDVIEDMVEEQMATTLVG